MRASHWAGPKLQRNDGRIRAVFSVASASGNFRPARGRAALEDALVEFSRRQLQSQISPPQQVPANRAALPSDEPIQHEQKQASVSTPVENHGPEMAGRRDEFE